MPDAHVVAPLCTLSGLSDPPIQPDNDVVDITSYEQSQPVPATDVICAMTAPDWTSDHASDSSGGASPGPISPLTCTSVLLGSGSSESVASLPDLGPCYTFKDITSYEQSQPVPATDVICAMTAPDWTSDHASDSSGGVSPGPISPLTCTSVSSGSGSSESVASLMEGLFAPDLGPCYTFKVVGDNIDKSVHPRHMRMDYQAKSLHYFHIYGVLDRIDFSSLDDNIRVPDTTKIDFAEIMPSLEDVIAIKKCFSLHILRTLKKYSSFFLSVGKGVERHIQHYHSVQMAKKSNIVRTIAISTVQCQYKKFIIFRFHLVFY